MKTRRVGVGETRRCFYLNLLFVFREHDPPTLAGHEHARSEVEEAYCRHEGPPQAAAEHARVDRDGEELQKTDKVGGCKEWRFLRGADDSEWKRTQRAGSNDWTEA